MIINRNFLKLESFCGVLLFFCAIAALILANSSLAGYYQALFKVPFAIQLGSYHFSRPILFWINDGLMSIFFLLVGLELKREFFQGELASIKKIVLPGFAALGGMIVPVIIYSMVNHTHPEALKGWAIPVATDIAFAIGVLSLFGKRVPIGLKLFLLSLSIFDDVGAIIIVAVFHTSELSYISFLFALTVIGILGLLNYFNVQKLTIYIFLGLVLWICVLKSGIHTTVSGVILAFLIPIEKMPGTISSPGRRLEKYLEPWVSYLVMPLFALGNAGVALRGLGFDIVFGHVTFGIVLGLFLGKQLGIMSFSWLIVRLGFAKLPDNTNWLHIYGMAVICGIGFTMSLFLGTLAFEHDSPSYFTQVRLGVLFGSIISGMMGALILHGAFKRRGMQT